MQAEHKELVKVVFDRENFDFSDKRGINARPLTARLEYYNRKLIAAIADTTSEHMRTITLIRSLYFFYLHDNNKSDNLKRPRKVINCLKANICSKNARPKKRLEMFQIL